MSYQALHSGAALIDLSKRGRIRVAGEDGARFLHAMSTNHVQQLKPGENVYAFFLNSQGRILADANILCFDGSFLLDTEPDPVRLSLQEHLDRFIIADDVTLSDESEATFCLGIEGPQSDAVLKATSMPAGCTVAAISYTGAPGYRIFGPLSVKEELSSSLRTAGAAPSTLDDAETARLEHFKPRYGPDLNDKCIPQDTQQMRAVHFQKGCYIGQEIVERVRARGHVNRLLMGFQMEPGAPLAADTKIYSNGEAMGEVTSFAVNPSGGIFGLGYVRRTVATPGAAVQIDGRPAILSNPY